MTLFGKNRCPQPQSFLVCWPAARPAQKRPQPEQTTKFTGGKG